jgi:hypothetical protein
MRPKAKKNSPSHVMVAMRVLTRMIWQIVLLVTKNDELEIHDYIILKTFQVP